MATTQLPSTFFDEKDDIKIGDLVRIKAHSQYKIFNRTVSEAFRNALHTAIQKGRKFAFEGVYGRVVLIEEQQFEGPSGKITSKPIFWVRLSDKNLEGHVKDHFKKLYDFLPCKLSQVRKCGKVKWDFTDEHGFDGRMEGAE